MSPNCDSPARLRSEEHTSELQSRAQISYAGFCLKKKISNCPIGCTITPVGGAKTRRRKVLICSGQSNDRVTLMFFFRRSPHHRNLHLRSPSFTPRRSSD